MKFTEEQIQQQINNCFVGHCSNGHLDLVEMLMNKTEVDVNARDNMTNETALIGACEGGHVKIVSYLLEKGADVNAKQHCYNCQGVTSLMKASNQGHAKIVKILLENGADVDCKTSIGNTALMKAMEKGHVNIVRLIKNHINRIILLVIEKGRTKDETHLVRHSHKDIAKYIASFF